MPETAPSRLVAQKASFQRALLGWYGRGARDLPWRRAPSLYRTVVSEFMLQQTQMTTVLPYFQRWMEALPDFAALASASEDKVLKLWEGLGYYSRARNLRRLAQAVAAMPEPPRTAKAWGELPGVGPYTACAIASIAFGEPVPCVDGNVVRILTRLACDPTEFCDSASAARVLAPLAGALVPAEAPGDHNQAMMELGATVCLRRKPLCLLCPVRRHCAGADADPERYPNLASRTVERRSLARFWCVRRGALLLHRAHAGAMRLAALHELPTAEQAFGPAGAVGEFPLLVRRTRTITRFRITESIHAAPPPRGALPDGTSWVPFNRLEDIVLSGPHRRWIAELLSWRTTRTAPAKGGPGKKRKPGASAGAKPRPRRSSAALPDPAHAQPRLRRGSG